MAGGVGQRDVQADDVRARQQLVQCRDETRQTRVVPRGVDHFHVETRCSLSHGLADTAESDQPERRAVHVTRQVGAESPALPAALPKIPLGVGGQSCRREDQEERQVGRRVVEHPRRVAHGDTQVGSRGDVDVVVPDGGVGHHTESPGAS